MKTEAKRLRIEQHYNFCHHILSTKTMTVVLKARPLATAYIVVTEVVVFSTVIKGLPNPSVQNNYSCKIQLRGFCIINKVNVHEFCHLQAQCAHYLSCSVIQYLLLRIWRIKLSWYDVCSSAQLNNH